MGNEHHFKEFLEMYINLWEKRLENASALETEQRKMVRFAHFAVKRDILSFLNQ